MSVALLFIDGVGIGARDPARNPLARARHLLSRFDDGDGEPLPSGGVAVPVDTTFGVPGRPQSATNQTAILTGDPAPVLLGKHLLGFPNAFLREHLSRRSIVKRLVSAGRGATFANAYPREYLEALGLPHRTSSSAAPPDLPEQLEIPARYARKLRPSATTVAMAAGGVALRTLDDARAGEAITNDVTAERARARGFDVPERSPDEAAAIFWRLSEGQRFTLFENYLADEAGHAQDFEAAAAALETFDRFARAVVERRPKGGHVIVCSDHGNVEDLSTRSHTLNPVAVLYFGDAPWVASALSTVADVGSVVLRLCEVAP